MKRTLIKGLLVIGMACLIFACGKKQDDTPESEESKTEQAEGEEGQEEEKKEEDGDSGAEEKAGEPQIVGTESEDAYKLLLTNHTGEAITGFSVKAFNEAEFPENMMGADMKIENDGVICLYYAAPENDAAGSSSGKLLRTTYEFHITNESGREIGISGLLFDDMQEAELCFEDEVGFIRYVSVASGEEISTKEMALSLQQVQ